jgi:hypothetical protein
MLKPTALLFSFGLLAMCSCRTLRTSQTKLIDDFATAARTVVQTPPQIYSEYYLLKDAPRLLKNSVTFAIDKDSTLKYPLRELQETYTQMQANAAIVKGYAATVGILESFATLLKTLSDTKYIAAFSKQQGEFKVRLDSMVNKYNYLQPEKKIAPSLTSVITKVLDAMSTRAIKSMQRKYIEELLVEGETSIKGLCNLYVETIAPEATININNLEKELQNDFKEYVINLKASDKTRYSDPVLYQERIIPVYLDWSNRQKKLVQLQKASIAGMKGIVEVYEILVQKIKSKASIKESIEEVKSLQKSAAAIKDAYDTYTEEKEKMQTIVNPSKK